MAVAERETDEFTLDDQWVSSLVTIFRTADRAETLLTEFEDLWARCEGELSTAIAKMLTEGYASAGGADASFSLSINELDAGDWGSRMTVESNVEAFDGLVVDTVLVIEGRLIGRLGYGALASDDEGFRDELVAIVAERMSAADAILPE